jgi:DNA-binding MarR family transcriptional regulator
LNVNGVQTTVEPAESRQAVTDELLRELTSWNPRERAGVFRKWLRGSLSLVHLHVLTVLEAGGPTPMGKLADALDVSVASATGIVDRMEQRGLVERRDDDADRRLVLVQTTDSGLLVFKVFDEQREAALRRLIDRLTDEEQAALLVGLRAVRRAREALAAEEEPAP